MTGMNAMMIGRTRTLRRGALALLLAGGLAACGNAPTDPLVSLGRAFAGIVTGGQGDAGQTADEVRAGLTSETISTIGRPFLLVHLVRANAASLMIDVNTTNGNTSWRDAGNNQITLTQNGVLRSTRGFGFDLMSSDVGQVANQLSRGQSGTVERTHIYVDGTWQSTPVSITCQMSVGAGTSMVVGGRTQSLRPVTETCRYGSETFENRYWIDRNGQARKSIQWIGPELGYLEVERYVP